MQRMLSTSDFATAVGISESSVRRLADSGELEIRRTHGGHRRIPVAEAIRYVREMGITVVRPEMLGLIGPAETDVAQTPEESLVDALTEGNAGQVIGVMQSMYASGTSIAAICDGAIRNAMDTIGSRWPQDKRSIFIEHRATLLCVRALCQIRLAIPNPDQDAPTAMGGAPQDDPYLLPSLMVSLVLHDCGYEETNLGPNTPIDVLTDSVEDEQPDLVWLAITNPIRSRQQSRELDELVKVIQSYHGTLLIGGRSADTYQHAYARHCDTMADLNRQATNLSATLR